MRKLLDWIATKLGYVRADASPMAPNTWIDDEPTTEFAEEMARELASKRLKVLLPYVRRLAGLARVELFEYPRIHNGADAIARGQRWEAFYSEEGGVGDMITSLRRDYFEKVGSLKPGDADGLRSLGMADRIAREIDQKVRDVIETGKIARSNAEHVNRVASIRR